MNKQKEFNEEITRIFVNGKIKPINWGADQGAAWNVWSDQEKLKYAMDLASAMNQAADMMQKDRNRLAEELAASNRAVEAAEERCQIFKESMTEAITDHNRARQVSAQQLQAEQATSKILRKEIDNLRLGKFAGE